MLHNLSTSRNGGNGSSQMLSYFDAQKLNSFHQIQTAEAQQFDGLMSSNDESLSEIVSRAIKADPAGLENSWADIGLSYVPTPTPTPTQTGVGIIHSPYGMNYAISRTTSCPPDNAVKHNETLLSSRRDSFKKRKADKNYNLKEEVTQEDVKSKKMEVCCTEEQGSTEEKSNKRSSNNSKETCDTCSKDKSKVTEDKKSDYIHVRARRGQATDSHSLAERVRREKISERMRFLQDLVPGCNKITGKAGMLDEIINYVQSLQRQVEFLSMKLAAVDPGLDIDVDNFFDKEIFAGAGTSSEMLSLAHCQFNSLQQILSTSSGIDMGILNTSDLCRTTSAPVSPIPQTFLDASSINQVQSIPSWEQIELDNLYAMELQQGRSLQFIPTPFTGFAEAGSDLKREM